MRRNRPHDVLTTIIARSAQNEKETETFSMEETMRKILPRLLLANELLSDDPKV